MDTDRPDPPLMVVQLCANHVAAELIANLLRAEAIPARVRNLAAIPGLEQGTQVLVPTPMLRRAQAILERSRPSDTELNYLATGRL